MIDKAPSSIRSMFNRVAPRYDVINRILSCGIDVLWRKRVKRQISNPRLNSYADLATGTGDLLIEIMKSYPEIERGIGIDLSEGMLKFNKQKLSNYSFASKVELIHKDLTQTELQSGSIDLITIAFGIRNVEDKVAAIVEMARLLAPGGQLLILEFSLPKNSFIREFYLWYFRRILPRIGGWISGDYQAYRYLNESVESWIAPSGMLRLLQEAGLIHTEAIPLTFGIATLYSAYK